MNCFISEKLQTFLSSLTLRLLNFTLTVTLTVASPLLMSSSANAKGCAGLYAEAGAVPSTEPAANLTCKLRASTALVDMGTYYCTGSPDIIDRYCASSLPKNNSCDAQRSASNGLFNKPSSLVGNPCNAGTGNKFQAETDYAQTQPGGVALRRFYNSSAVTIGSAAWGPQWQSDYGQNILMTSSTQVLANRSDGKGFYFTLTNGVWSTDADTTERLSKTANGWQLIDNENTVEVYNNAGQLISILDRGGKKQTLQYSDGTTGLNGGYILNDDGTTTSSTLPQGLLISIADFTGRKLRFSYNTALHVVKMTDPNGENYLYTYNAMDNVASIKYPDGKSRIYIYNEPANTSGNDLPNALTGITDENGARFATWTYDAQGRAISSAHNLPNNQSAEKVSIAYTADSSGNVTSSNVASLDLNGNSYLTRNYSFARISGLVKNTGVTQPCGINCTATTTTTYDLNGNLKSQKDFNGNTVCFAYDLSRNLETVRVEGLAPGKSCPADLSSYTPTANSVERKISTAWHPTYRAPTQITEAGKTTAFNYDTAGNLLSKTITDTNLNKSRSWTYTYNSLGQMLTADGPRTDLVDKTTYTYYSSASNVTGSVHAVGDLATITNALGQVTAIPNYDFNGRPLTVVDTNNITTTLTYSPRGWLNSRTLNGTQTTKYDYDGVGQLIKVTLPDNSYLNYSYDTAHRLTDISDGIGNKIHFTLDAMGNRVQEVTTDASNAILKMHARAFDSLNRLQKDIGGTSPSTQITQYAYDNNSNLKTITDPLNHITINSYDTLNRLVTVTDPANEISSTGYNALDQITQVKDPRLVTTNYTINALGDITLTQSPDSGNTNSIFDTAGNLTQKTDARGIVSNYTYDALNRVTSITYPAHTVENVSFTYDSTANGNYGKGKLTGYSNDGGATVLTYDAYGNVIQSTDMIASKIYVTAYSFDSANRLAKITYPSGRIITYTRNNLGQITQVQLQNSAGAAFQTVASGITYRPFGPLSVITFANGVATTVQYDQDYRMSRSTTGSNPTRDVSYSYDANSNITQLTDAHGTYTKSYGYDALGHLISDSNDAGKYLYQYDASGNRTQMTVTNTANSTSTVPEIYAANSNRMTSLSGIPTTYDAAGNLTNYLGSFTYTYNNANRTSTTNIIAGTQAIPIGTYAYNALGRRTQIMNNQHFLYTVDGKYLETSVYGSTTLSKRIEYVYVDDLPIAQLQDKFNSNGTLASTQITYIHADHLNTPRALTDRSGKLTWQWEGDAFGTHAPIQTKDVDGQLDTLDLRFPGQLADNGNLFFYNINRFYDPTSGRYSQSDPIGLSGGLNTYGYVNENPILFTDPSGLIVRVETTDPVAARLLMNAYAKMNRTKRGMEINKKLENSCDVYTIRPKDHDAYYCPASATDPKCAGKTKAVFVDPYNQIWLPTTQGMRPTPLEVVVGHELGHANGEGDDGPNAMNNVNTNENPIRQDLGLPSRTSYYLNSQPVWTPSR